MSESSAKIALESLRKEYTLRGLSRDELKPDPIDQFGLWFQEAVSAGLTDPNAMTLATAGADGQPHARIVLLKGCDRRGFVFFTHYESAKGRELESNPKAALVFLWADLERQVRIEGITSLASREESEAYFKSRPLGSQLAAWASPQSEIVPDRAYLETQWEQMRAKYADGPVPLPPHWGGYRLAPSMIEFWQGRPSRLHDRFRYAKQADESWRIERLAP